MRLESDLPQLVDYQRVEQAIGFIEANFKSQLSLEQIAKSVSLSKYHFDRLFKQWAGISPIQFLQFMTLDYTKQRLLESQSVLDTALEAGLSGPSRLHDLFVTFEAMTPGEFKKQASGVDVTYGFSHSPFGGCLVAMTQRGICHLGFVSGNHQAEAAEELFQLWPDATFTEDAKAVRSITERLFQMEDRKQSQPFHLHLKGTNFQVNVWKALLRIPEGNLVSYKDVASYLGQPKAFRAVASAIAMNPIAYLIPCHRVIAKSGKIHQYRWGAARKKALIGWEAAKTK